MYIHTRLCMLLEPERHLEDTYTAFMLAPSTANILYYLYDDRVVHRTRKSDAPNTRPDTSWSATIHCNSTRRIQQAATCLSIKNHQTPGARTEPEPPQNVPPHVPIGPQPNALRENGYDGSRGRNGTDPTNPRLNCPQRSCFGSVSRC